MLLASVLIFEVARAAWDSAKPRPMAARGAGQAAELVATKQNKVRAAQQQVYAAELAIQEATNAYQDAKEKLRSKQRELEFAQEAALADKAVAATPSPARASRLDCSDVDDDESGAVGR